MPSGDRTGPMGAGAMTGRAAGYCAGFGMPGFMNRGYGRFYGGQFRGAGRGGMPYGGGRGRAWGGGRGPYWRSSWNAPYYSPAVEETHPDYATQREELDYLRGQVESMAQTISKLEKKLAETSQNSQQNE